MTGEELFDRYGKDLLGAWEDQDQSVQEAWETIAAGVSVELEIAARQVLGEPPFEDGPDDRLV